MTTPYQPSAAERQELADITAYLRSFSGDFSKMPEGSIAAVLNRASPNVRAHVKANADFVEHVLQGGKSEPFQPRLEIDRSKVDPATEAVAAQSRTEDYSHALMERMNTAASSQQENGPPNRRDYIEAAFDAHTQQEQ